MLLILFVSSYVYFNFYLQILNTDILDNMKLNKKEQRNSLKKVLQLDGTFHQAADRGIQKTGSTFMITETDIFIIMVGEARV